MTLPSAVVPQKKEMEPPNQNASQIARIHYKYYYFGVNACESTRTARPAEVNNIISAIFTPAILKTNLCSQETAGLVFINKQ